MQTAVEQEILNKLCSSITVNKFGEITIWVAEVIPFLVCSTGLNGRGI